MEIMAVKPFKIICGNLHGFLYPEHFGPAGRSLCIKLDKKDKSSWISPIEFEKKSGKGAQHNWKRTVRSTSHDNKMLWYLLDEKILNACLDKHCQCTPCRRSREGEIIFIILFDSRVQACLTCLLGVIPPVTSSPKTTLDDAIKVPAASTKSNEKQRDTDSDSGISVEISNVSSPMKPIPHEPLSTKEQEKLLPNYTLMVQEAIVALTTGDKNKDVNGCSLLGIFLYILHNYPMIESVEVMNEKIRSTLALLKRMGIVERVDTDTEHDNDELEIQPKIVQDSDDNEEEPEIIKVVNNMPKKIRKSESKKATSKPTLMAKKKVAKMIAASKNVKTGKENANTSQVVVQQKPKRLSPALALICGRKLLNRHEALKAIWRYIKKHDLQDPSQRTIIVCDDKLKAVTKKKRVTSSEILTCLGSNMTTL